MATDPNELLSGIPALKGARAQKQLAAGPVSDKWLINGPLGNHVLRLDRPFARTAGLNRSDEASALSILSAAGQISAPLYCEPERGLLVTDYQAGRVWQTEDFRRAENLWKLARYLRQLHELALPGPDFQLENKLRHYANGAGTKEADGWCAEALDLLAPLQANSGRVMCHNDPVAGNVVDGSHLRLIDWEFAAVGDPLFDLANVIEYHELNLDLHLVFVREYLSPGPPEAAGEFLLRLDGWCRVVRLLNRLWYAMGESANR